MQLHVAPQTMMQLDCHVACMIQNQIGHIGKLHRLSREVAAANAEKHFGMDENLK